MLGGGEVEIESPIKKINQDIYISSAITSQASMHMFNEQRYV